MIVQPLCGGGGRSEQRTAHVSRRRRGRWGRSMMGKVAGRKVEELGRGLLEEDPSKAAAGRFPL
ncbi:UNVERIFIED_CONTAM: hypothetical protein Slati_2980500 [Sesamum latifolium]|uniref:Uncharacterized protein n=1 Tax=Sesamum latifolium TaxID=2727402 RepID=A0AAW2VIL3_9LAMI